ncbi:MAG: SDR family oxidoreductase [Acholeplasmataceae bacterium]|nr:SDR family oxidoreductase [Acholeplasmataceae bacterium]
MKVVIVTGASSGIGLAIAQHLCKKGYKVYGFSRSKIYEKGILSIQVDVTDLNQIKSAFKDIYDQEGKIDVLINNAGMGISGSIEDTSFEDASYLMHVNFLGTFNTTKVAIPLMREGGGGKILNISSVASKLSIPFQAFYSASKAAVNAFTDALANEVQPFHIQTCAILPGDIKTGFTKNRKKNLDNDPSYHDRVEKSVEVMEQDELNGMDPEVAARTVEKLIRKKRIPLQKTIGTKYKVFVFLSQVLPHRWVNQIVGKIYGFKKRK